MISLREPGSYTGVTLPWLDDLDNAFTWDPVDKVVYRNQLSKGNRIQSLIRDRLDSKWFAGRTCTIISWQLRQAGCVKAWKLTGLSHTLISTHDNGPNGCGGTGSFTVDTYSLVNGAVTTVTSPSGCPASTVSDTVGMAFDYEPSTNWCSITLDQDAVHLHLGQRGSHLHAGDLRRLASDRRGFGRSGSAWREPWPLPLRSRQGLLRVRRGCGARSLYSLSPAGRMRPLR